MPAARIDRLNLDAGQMELADARRLAMLVATGLADAQIAPAAIPRLALSVESGPGGVDELARRIVAEAVRQIGRAP
jgi:hypothetical protein